VKVFTVIGVIAVAVGVARAVEAFAGVWTDPDYVQRAWERNHR
jgi:hypothetical protein